MKDDLGTLKDIIMLDHSDDNVETFRKTYMKGLRAVILYVGECPYRKPYLKDLADDLHSAYKSFKMRFPLGAEIYLAKAEYTIDKIYDKNKK